jgi:hypothetical protein
VLIISYDTCGLLPAFTPFLKHHVTLCSLISLLLAAITGPAKKCMGLLGATVANANLLPANRYGMSQLAQAGCQCRRGLSVAESTCNSANQCHAQAAHSNLKERGNRTHLQSMNTIPMSCQAERGVQLMVHATTMEYTLPGCSENTVRDAMDRCTKHESRACTASHDPVQQKRSMILEASAKLSGSMHQTASQRTSVLQRHLAAAAGAPRPRLPVL